MLKAAEAQAKARDTGNAPHLIITARAGTGKTTTLVEGLKRVKGLPSPFEPSPQQAMIWELMAQGAAPLTICFVAFNKAIAAELGTRVPIGCEAMTLHGMGYRAVAGAYGRVQLNDYRVQDIIGELLGVNVRDLRRNEPLVVKATEDLVGLCKMNLADGTEEELAALAAHYDVDLNGGRAKVFDLVPRVLDRCKDIARDYQIDYDDMVYLPVALGLPVRKFDLLLVDEAQDLNRCQQQLALAAGKRLILCGDPKQAIYGFAGADAESMPRMAEILRNTDRGCVGLPLTVTRRCGKAIVEEARKLVDDFEAHPSNGPGLVGNLLYETPKGGNAQSYHSLVQAGDMVLCRVNAPLVSQCFRFIKAGRKANIQGRDVGKGLISTLKKMKATSVVDLVAKLTDWHHAEESKEQAKRNPSEQRLIALNDRLECLLCFTDGASTVGDVTSKIEQVFTDDKQAPGIRLSSLHKSKGLEARRVFFLMPKGAGCPHLMAKTPHAREQELNLKYVGITRAIEEMYYVSSNL